MENENENFNSINEDNNIVTDDTIVTNDISALKEKLTKTEEANRQLFERAKKAEGFDKVDGKWVKAQKPEPKKSEVMFEKSDDLDYGHLAFHNSKAETKVEHEEDVEFLKKTIKDSGKRQNEILSAPWFMGELKDRQGQRAVKEALPSASGRGASVARDTVDYWLAKGELPPRDQYSLEFRNNVLNARLEKEKEGSKFAPTPYIIS